MQTKMFKAYVFTCKILGKEFAVLSKDEKSAELAFSRKLPHSEEGLYHSKCYWCQVQVTIIPKPV